jgi:hypothetical protein
MKKYVFFLLLFAIPLGCGLAQQAPITFTKVVDTDTPIPGGSGTFTRIVGDFEWGPSLGNGHTGFMGIGSGNQQGVYVFDGNQLNMVADIFTSVPGQDLFFKTFGEPSIDEDVAVFAAGIGITQPSPWPHDSTGVYKYENGVLTTIADWNTPIPESTENFRGVFGPSHDNGNTVFVGFGPDDVKGIYAENAGNIQVVVSRNKPRPCVCEDGVITILVFHEISRAIAINDDIVICGMDSSGTIGLYRYKIGSDTLNLIASTHTPIPQGLGTFIKFGSGEGFDGHTVAFVGYGENGQEGVYAYENGELRVVADQNTLIPNATGPFLGFWGITGVSVSNGNIAFAAAGNGHQGGIYLSHAGNLYSIIQNGDSLDGKPLMVTNPPPDFPWWWTVPPLSIHSEAFDGNQVAFVAGFPDGSGANFIANVENLVDTEDLAQNDPDLLRVYPNPGRSNFTFELSVEHSTEVLLNVINPYGGVIESIFSGKISKGTHQFNWNPAYLPEGVFYAQFMNGHQVQTNKILVLRN